MRTVRDARSEPYRASREHITRLTLALEPGATSTAPMLVLRPAQEFASDLFGQIFQRAMESMKGSTTTGIPVVLRGEYDRALSAHMTPESLLDSARAAGLESTAIQPLCVAMRRISEPGVTRQLYFVIFDAPAVGQFRQQLAVAAGLAGGAQFAPDAQSPILIIGASDDAFARWLPIRAEESADCVAPIELE